MVLRRWSTWLENLSQLDGELAVVLLENFGGVGGIFD